MTSSELTLRFGTGACPRVQQDRGLRITAKEVLEYHETNFASLGYAK
jgi:hypothetical protein